MSIKISRRQALTGGLIAAFSGCSTQDTSTTPTSTATEEPPLSTTKSARQGTSRTLNLSGAWPSHRYDFARTGHNPRIEGPTDLPSVRWRFTPNGFRPVPEEDQRPQFGRSPVILADLVVAIIPVEETYNGHTFRVNRVFGIDRATGQEVWRAEATQLRRSSKITMDTPIAHNGVVFAGANAIKAQSGRQTWQSQSYTTGSPDVVHDGKLFFTEQKYEHRNWLGLVAIDSASGEVIWSKDNHLPEGKYPSPFILGDGTLFYYGQVSDELSEVDEKNIAKLVAIDPNTGELRWETLIQIPGPLTNFSLTRAPVFANGRVLFAAQDAYYKQHVIAYDATDGTTIWKTVLPESEVLTPFTVDAETIYAAETLGGSNIYAFDITDGSQRWTLDINTLREGPNYYGFSAGVLADDLLYLCVNWNAIPNSILALRAETGEVLWEFREEDDTPIGSDPALTENEIYTYGVDGAVYALSG